MPHLCAFGCRVKDVPVHVFPSPDKFPERFKTWVSLVGGKLETSSDYEFYKRKRICDIHFIEAHRSRFKRLNALAVPILHIPNTSSTLSVNAAMDYQPADNTHPADAMDTFEIQHQQSQLPLYSPSSISCSTTEVLGPIGNGASVFAEHNYSVMTHLYNKPSIKDTPRKKCSTALRPLQKKVRNLQSEIRRLRKKGLSYKERLQNATNISNGVAFQLLTEQMTGPAKLFLEMQLQIAKKPKGRRFSTEQKILALSLYKKSPKNYGLLHKYFCLPSSKAMKRLLSQINIIPGINKVIFEKIENKIRTQALEDRVCSLIFDEMSITPHVTYVGHKDTLEGFSENGNFADHVLVFMLKGVKNSIKQPIAYYFTTSLCYGARNISPNTVAFEGAFKSLLLNNFASPHSGRGNCEEDNNECLQTLEFMLTKQQSIATTTPDLSEEKEFTLDTEICIDHPQAGDGGQGNYVCGWVLKKCLQKVVKKCQKCRNTLLDLNKRNENNVYIKRKEYQNKNWLCYPNKNTEACFKDIKNVTAQFLKTNVPKNNLKRFIIASVDNLVEYPFECNMHKEKLKEMFVNTVINIIIFSWCRSINRILSGKLSYVGDDDVKTAAQNYFNKHKNYKNRK